MSATTSDLDLSKVYRRPIFQSRSAVKSHAVLSKTISGHELIWGKGQVNTRLFRCDVNRISLMSLGYGAEVEIQASGFDGFSLVQMPLRGAAEFMSDGVPLTVVPGDIAILTPKKRVHTLWRADCEQLILKIPHHLADDVWVKGTSKTSASSQFVHDLARSPAYKIKGQLAQQWGLLLQHLLRLPETGKKSPLNADWLLHFEKSIALFLFSHQPDSPEIATVSTPPCLDRLAVEPSQTSAQLRRLEEYVRSNMGTKITLMDLANVVGVSVRTLNMLCHRNEGVSPMIWLRNLRLDAARKVLRSNQRASVTEVALAHGFDHLGRFSAYYQDRFGELPRQTETRLRPNS